jgi:hypothetical protein
MPPTRDELDLLGKKIERICRAHRPNAAAGLEAEGILYNRLKEAKENVAGVGELAPASILGHALAN